MPDADDVIPLSDVAGTVKLGQVFRRMTLSNVLETSLITFFYRDLSFLRVVHRGKFIIK